MLKSRDVAHLDRGVPFSHSETRFSFQEETNPDSNGKNPGLFSWLTPSAQWWSPLRAAEDGKEEIVLTI
jgi:hypothetical protein